MNSRPYPCPVIDEFYSIVWCIDAAMAPIVYIARGTIDCPPTVSRITGIMNTIGTMECHPIIHP